MAVRKSRGRSNWGRVQKRAQFSPGEQRLILNRDHNVCYLCRNFADEADHVIPIAEGGANHPDNGRAICSECHTTKSREEAARGYARRQERLKLKPEPRPFDHFKPKD